MSLLEVRDLCAGYGAQRVLSGVNLRVDAGEVVGLLGANGCGKTTLIKAVCGLLPASGRVTIAGRDASTLSAREMARLTGYIPQRSGVSIDISALDVTLMGFNAQLGLLGQPGAQMRESAKEALALVGLGGRENDNYQHLSEGQKQLCILARTLVTGSRLLLLDEPESALDFRFRAQMLALIRRAAEKEGRGALIALHEAQLALNGCDRLLLLAPGGGTCEIAPGRDTLDTMETALARIYGPVSLHRVTGRSGRTQLVMIREDA